MASSTIPSPTTPAAKGGDEVRRHRLRTARRRATGLLVATALALLSLTLFTDETVGWAGYLTAALQGATVGGLADWFAVTALFRYPLGIPLPHTAIIVERKDTFGRTLGEFVQEELLTPDAIVERVRNARVTERAAEWLSAPENAAGTAHHLADAAVTLADLLRDDDIHEALDEALRSRIEATPLAPLAGRGLQLFTDGGRHQDVLDAALRATDRLLQDNRDELRARFGHSSPWWLPGAAEDRIFERLMDGARSLLHEVASNPHHKLRRDFEDRVRRFAEDLQTSPELLERGEAIKLDLLSQPQLRRWTADVWRDIKAELRTQADDPDSELRGRLAQAIASLGDRLRRDPGLTRRVDEAIESGVRRFGEQFHNEVAWMVGNTISRWDAHEAATRLELLLGPDLQFIRINGTLIGGLAGLVIHAATQALG